MVQLPVDVELDVFLTVLTGDRGIGAIGLIKSGELTGNFDLAAYN